MTEEEFFASVDKIIQLANEMNEQMATSRVSAILMYANARYNAFNFFATDGKAENQSKAMDYFVEQYRKMLAENMEELKPRSHASP